MWNTVLCHPPLHLQFGSWGCPTLLARLYAVKILFFDRYPGDRLTLIFYRLVLRPFGNFEKNYVDNWQSKVRLFSRLVRLKWRKLRTISGEVWWCNIRGAWFHNLEMDSRRRVFHALNLPGSIHRIHERFRPRLIWKPHTEKKGAKFLLGHSYKGFLTAENMQLRGWLH
jgi:hypothetical protein